MKKIIDSPQFMKETGIEAPYSSGTQYPQIAIPANACDCHHHIYDPARFPYDPKDNRNQPPGTVSDYRLLQKRLCTTRNVIIQPSVYGVDNSCTLDALKTMGAANTRAVAVINASISDKELEQMHRSGVRGIRINTASPMVINTIDTIESLAERVNELGWHVEFWMKADDIAANKDLLMRLPTSIVFGHLGHIPQPDGVNHPAFGVLCNLLEQGKTWIKLSGAYQDTKIGAPSYADVTKLAQAFVKVAPERMLWGTDWPHPTIYSRKQPWPDDSLLLDLLGEWALDENTKNQILVGNPAVLYGFPK
jgi:D-galactarolactone isomerase